MIFFSREVQDNPRFFEDLAGCLPHYAWGNYGDPNSPSEYPRTGTLTHHPDVKFEFLCLEHWQGHKNDIRQAAFLVHDTAPRNK